MSVQRSHLAVDENLNTPDWLVVLRSNLDPSLCLSGFSLSSDKVG